jgi:hypothetical protein
MHESIGRKQDHGRVALADLVDRPHFYGVGAVEELRGEITILDSVAVVTGETPEGRLESPSADIHATLLVGSSVPEWTTHILDEPVSEERVEAAISVTAKNAGLDPAVPFVFILEGELTNVRLHVINGACPVHARMKKITLDDDERPFELEATSLEGTVVGVYAEDSVGRLTHPATSIHAHLIWKDAQTGEPVTGHLERFGLASGAVLELPR